MQTFSIQKVDMPYIEVGVSDWFDYSDVEFPKKIELTLNVSKLQMGVNDGSTLNVAFERTIDEVVVGSDGFNPVNIPDDNLEPSEWLQTLILKEGDLGLNGKKILLGNKGRFRFSLSQASLNTQNVIPSVASFSAAVLIK